MAEIFENYEQEYCELATSVKRHIQTLATATGETRKQVLATAERESDEANDILQQMSLEARVAVGPTKEQLRQRLANYQKDAAKVKADLKRIKLEPAAGAAGDRDALFAGADPAAGDQRQRLLATTDKLNDSGRRIKDATRVAAETEQIGVTIMSDLQRQRETIERTQGHLRETNTNISRSRRILGTMARRIVTNKILMFAIILILVFAIAMVVYFKFIKGS
jgi:vesicle transport through interaction with t-SNAREs protein 1